VDIELVKEVNSQLLLEEMAERFPEWVDENNLLDPYRFAVVFYDTGKVTLRVPDDADLKAVKELIDAHDPKRLTRREHIRQMVLNAASGAAGKNVKSLTTAEQRALLACLLFRAGAIDENGIVQPLEDWIGG